MKSGKVIKYSILNVWKVFNCNVIKMLIMSCQWEKWGNGSFDVKLSFYMISYRSYFPYDKLNGASVKNKQNILFSYNFTWNMTFCPH